ncbi:MAG TPA: Hsp20/alpha crystallin family protein [Anaerolinea thermolimosa]|uniref:Hsp20/alpha crystallin family protein n=1 Tax=Anaerolinea thermolimosa TaxID=229919 RepID=A0A3D1JE45_9CHLR|nr:Hsp20/alpha crystallin family protein [Anaerolinea thermolimosa]GAP07577.1 molecular chaperone [Anaerolinea thermolimosa]HCE16694.1 Hsp20/alpha crystallin family protein [Anaerolinea thermolimosa]
MIYRRYTLPSIWEEMDRMQRELDRLMNAFMPERGRVTSTFPAINAWTNDEEEIVTAELPGVDPKDIDLSIVNDVLTISGERKPVDPAEDIRYHRRERVCGKFNRSIQLAFPVDSDKVTASYENGILKVVLPRAEADKPRKISVKAS